MSKSEGQILDFEKICRLCLLEKRSMSAIFSKKKSDKKVPLPVRIMSCASLELYEGDGLPASICSKCLLSVNQSYAFREQCEQADTTLRQYAQRMNEASEEASTNRESGELIANNPLESIQDIGFKRVEGRDDNQKEKTVCQTNNLDLETCKYSERDFRNDVFFSSSENKKVIFKANLEKEIMSKNLKDEEDAEIKMPFFKKTNNKTIDNLNCKGNVQGKFEKEDSFDTPVLKTLSNEKAENVVVLADVDTINARFPSDVEDGDVDIGQIENTSSDEANSRTKVQIPFRNVLEKKTMKGASFVPLFKANRWKSYTKSLTQKSSFGNQKHMELLQNLMKNKNIIVQKIAASGSMEIFSGKDFAVKNQEFKNSVSQKKNITFPYDFKIAQLWKEWEEVSKRIPQEKNSEIGIGDLKSNGKETKGSISPELVFEKFADCNETEGDRKSKWKNGKNTVYCKECRIFLLRSSYNNHIKFVHQKVRKYLCQTCGYTACTGTILRQHLQAVHVGYSFSCDQCPKKFNLMKRLRKHVEMEHSGKPIERNHICQYCGMAFVKHACLKRHLRTHTQETPYECQYCQRRFKYRWPKVQHERLHTGEQPYKCSFCEERFTQNSVRKVHEYKKHGNEKCKPKARTTKEHGESAETYKSEKEESEVSSHGSCQSGSESNYSGGI